MVRVIQASCYEAYYWICEFEATGREGVVAEYEFGGLIQNRRGEARQPDELHAVS